MANDSGQTSSEEAVETRERADLFGHFSNIPYQTGSSRKENSPVEDSSSGTATSQHRLNSSSKRHREGLAARRVEHCIISASPVVVFARSPLAGIESAEKEAVDRKAGPKMPASHSASLSLPLSRPSTAPQG